MARPPAAAGRPQLPAHQPRPAHRADALHGLVQPDPQPLAARLSIAVWKLFTDLDLREAKQQRFDSLHDCFTRELKPGARSRSMRDPIVLASPCDAIVGACGAVQGGQRVPGQGLPVPPRRPVRRRGRTRRALPRRQLRHAAPDARACTTASMRRTTAASSTSRYHQRRHLERQPDRARARRAPVLPQRARRDPHAPGRAGGHPLALVPVAAILVASIRLHFLDVLLHLRYRGPQRDALRRRAWRKGQELGWFEHGSTIIVFAPRGFTLCAGHRGRPAHPHGAGLMRLPARGMTSSRFIRASRPAPEHAHHEDDRSRLLQRRRRPPRRGAGAAAR